MPRPLAVATLLVTTVVWGLAFVAQKAAFDHMGPLTFLAARFILATVVLLPLAVWEYRRVDRPIAARHWPMIILLLVVFALGSWLQQAGLGYTSVTNAGFLTSLYVLLTPLLAVVALRHSLHPIIWIAVPMALLGVFMLNGARLDAFNPGDLMVIACAVCWAVQVLILGQISRDTGLPITLSVLCFIATAIACTGGMFVAETPTWSAIANGWVAIVYAGVMSTALGFSLQAIAQQHLPPSNAAIILASEGLFAAIGGAILLDERLTALGYSGAALIFAAILIVELVPLLRKRHPAVTEPG